MRRLGQLTEAALEAGWLAAVLLVPMFLDKATSQVFEPAKAGVLRALALFTLAAWLANALCSQRADAMPAAARARQAARAHWPWLSPVLLILLSTVLSTAVSLAPHESVWGRAGRAQGLLTLLAQLTLFGAVACKLRTREQLNRLITCLVLPSVPIASYAVFQRFGLEPMNVTSRETEIERVTSLLGQPVFLAAYLGMVMPFTAYRFHHWLGAKTAPATRLMGALSYGTLLVLQTTAALLTESRGPLLGIASAVAIGFAAWSVQRGAKRTLAAVWAVAALVGLAVAVRAPARLAEEARSAEAARIARRAAATFEATGAGGQFRVTAWAVAERVFQNDRPLELSDGTRDPHHGLRRMVGYGPEMQFAASPPFYDDELPRLFGYFIMDRYHNDLWDALITGGLLGLFAWLAVQTTLLWILVRALGLLAAPRARVVFWVSLGMSAALASGIAVALRGASFLFLGLQAGLVAGLFLVLSGTLLFAARPASQTPSDHTGILIAALAAVVCHFVEVSFSFTVVATGTLLWIIAALAVCLGPLRQAQHEEAQQSAPLVPALPSEAPTASPLLSLVVVTLGYVFLGSGTLSSRPGVVLWDGLTLLNQPPQTRFPAVAIILIGTLMLGALLLCLGDARAPRQLRLSRHTFYCAGLALAVALVAWLRFSFVLAGLGERASSGQDALLRTLDVRIGSTTSYYLLGAALLVWLSVALARVQVHLPNVGETQPSGPRVMFAGVCAVLVLALVFPLSLRPARADAATAVGDLFAQQGKLDQRIEAHRIAASLSPLVDGAQSVLAQGYVAKARADAAQAPSWLRKADDAFVTALKQNPAAGEHAVNVAMMRGNRALRATGAERQELAPELTELYLRALRRHPKDPAIWRAWANVQLNVLGDPQAALQSAERSAWFDTRNATTQGLIGECKIKLAHRMAGEARRKTYLEAAAAYETARALSPNQVGYRVNAAKAYVEAGEKERAIPLLRSALATLAPRSRAAQTTAALLKRAESDGMATSQEVSTLGPEQ